jgi:4-hydroxybenzoate polyprenyltransferase
MKLIPAFLRLIRWPNLVFILLTQVLFYYCIIIPLLNGTPNHPAALINGLSPSHFFFPAFYFWMVVTASVFVAAAGYIINDYFDLNIDLINKPSRLVVEKIIARRWAIIWHWVFSITGIALSVYAGYHLSGISAALLGMLNTGVVLLLVLYSISLKKQLLTGNIAIAVLSAWTIAILFFCTAKSYTTPGYHYVFDKTRLLRITLVYSVFAFIATLVREVIKDMEDIEGDARNGCKTMPVVWGINPSKVYAGVWIVVLAGLLVILQLYTFRFGWYGGVVYVLLALVLPLFYLLSELKKAMVVKDFHRLSTFTKLIILAGILSMLFFLIYNQTPQHIVLK